MSEIIHLIEKYHISPPHEHMKYAGIKKIETAPKDKKPNGMDG